MFSVVDLLDTAIALSQLTIVGFAGIENDYGDKLFRKFELWKIDSVNSVWLILTILLNVRDLLVYTWTIIN